MAMLYAEFEESTLLGVKSILERKLAYICAVNRELCSLFFVFE